MVHERKVYGFFDVLGDYGGVELVLQTFLLFIISPLAKHHFLTQAISALYRVNTKTNHQ